MDNYLIKCKLLTKAGASLPGEDIVEASLRGEARILANGALPDGELTLPDGEPRR